MLAAACPSLMASMVTRMSWPMRITWLSFLARTSILEAAKGISLARAIRLQPERESRLPTARYPDRHPVTVLGMAGFEWFSWAEGDRGSLVKPCCRFLPFAYSNDAFVP